MQGKGGRISPGNRLLRAVGAVIESGKRPTKAIWGVPGGRCTSVMNTNVAKPVRVAIIGASGTYGKGILARAEEIGVAAVVVTRSPHKFKDPKPTTTVAEVQLDDEEKLQDAFTGCDGVISALGDDRKERPKTHNLPHVRVAMKAAGVTKYIGMGSGPDARREAKRSR